MNPLIENNSIMNQTKKKLNDFDQYINRFTLNTQKELDLSSTILYGATKFYHSKAHEQINMFHDAFQSHLKQEQQKRQTFLSSSNKTSTLLKNKVTSQRTLAITGGALGGAFSGGALAAIKAPVAEHSVLKETSQNIQTSLEGQNGIKDTGTEASGLIEVVGPVGDVVLMTSAAVMAGRAGHIAIKCINHHRKKHENEQISDYLNDAQEPMVQLISSLFTLYATEALRRDDLNRAQINRWTEKKCKELMKNLVEPTEKMPHRIYDALLAQGSSTEVYALEKRKTTLKHWLGAFEETLQKDKHFKEDLGVFLKKLAGLCQKSEEDRIKSEDENNSKVSSLTSVGPLNFFSASKNTTSHMKPIKKESYALSSTTLT